MHSSTARISQLLIHMPPTTTHARTAYVYLSLPAPQTLRVGMRTIRTSAVHDSPPSVRAIFGDASL
eukprot:26908-Eustigmatos_ZCMA.PRE.1